MKQVILGLTLAVLATAATVGQAADAPTGGAAGNVDAAAKNARGYTATIVAVGVGAAGAIGVAVAGASDDSGSNSTSTSTSTATSTAAR